MGGFTYFYVLSLSPSTNYLFRRRSARHHGYILDTPVNLQFRQDKERIYSTGWHWRGTLVAKTKLSRRDQGPVHGSYIWLCIPCLHVQTGNDVRESGHGTMSMTSHCCVWLCDRWLKDFRHRDTGAKLVYFGALATISARSVCPESWRGEGTCWS